MSSRRPSRFRRRACRPRSRTLYSPAIIARSQARLEEAYAQAFPAGLTRYPVPVCATMTARLASLWDPALKQPSRRLTPEEDAFVAGERLLTKIDFRYWAERYAFINAGGIQLQRLTPFWESQEIILAEMARIQDDRIATGHTDGILINILKARQLGASTLGAALVMHRVTTQTHIRALLASDVPDNSGSEGLFGMYERVLSHLPWWLAPSEQFHTKNSHVIFDSGSAIFVESGKSMKGGLQERGATKGSLGRSRTYSTLHLTELSSWDRPEQINDSLLPAVPYSVRTLAIKESTAKGRHNWHHEDWMLGERGLGRFINCFVPWYSEEKKNWLPPPPGWVPNEETLLHAKKAEDEGPRWLHRPVHLSLGQLRWYETEREAWIARGQLSKFLEEQAADPLEAFQHSGRSIFTVDQLQYLSRLARPMVDCWTVQPAKEISAFRAEELAQIRRNRELAATAAQAAAEANKVRDVLDRPEPVEVR